MTTTATAGLAIECSPATIADVREFLATLETFGLPDNALLEGYVAYTSQSTPTPGENQTAVLPLDVVEVE